MCASSLARVRQLELSVRKLRKEHLETVQALAEMKKEAALLVQEAQAQKHLRAENKTLRHKNLKLTMTLKKQKVQTAKDLNVAIDNCKAEYENKLMRVKEETTAEHEKEIKRQAKLNEELQSKARNERAKQNNLHKSLRRMKRVAGVLAGVGLSLSAALITRGGTSTSLSGDM